MVFKLGGKFTFTKPLHKLYADRPMPVNDAG